MTEVQAALKCPYCREWTFEVKPPDNWHTEYSFEEPLISSIHGEVKTETFVCQNRKCKKPIILYWYAPIEYFNRM